MEMASTHRRIDASNERLNAVNPFKLFWSVVMHGERQKPVLLSGNYTCVCVCTYTRRGLRWGFRQVLMQNLLSYLEMAKRVSYIMILCGFLPTSSCLRGRSNRLCVQYFEREYYTSAKLESLWAGHWRCLPKKNAVMAWKYIGLWSRRVSDSWSLYDSRQDSLILSLSIVEDFVNFLRMYNDWRSI